ncbi:MAG: hypothetical protein QXG48_03550 [Thermofilaceae archaeon]
MSEKKRLVEHIETDSFVDLAFIMSLLKEPARLDVIEKQARMFVEAGDLGYDTLTFKRYSREAGAEVASMLGGIYGGTSRRTLERKAEDKTKRAWTAIVLFRALTRLLGSVYPEDVPPEKRLIPRAVEDPEKLLKVASVIIESKVAKRGTAGTNAIKLSMERLENLGFDPVRDFGVFLWWINIVMEASVIDAVVNYQYVVYLDRKHKLVEKLMKNLATVTEGRLLKKPDDWLELEIRKGLLSWCASLRGQYINKLQNAVLFIKLWRKSMKPARLQSWSWFLHSDPLTYSLAVYLAEPQVLLDMKMPIKVPLEKLMNTKDPRELSFLTLLMFSSVIHQHGVEVGEPKVTPMDVVIALLRVSKKVQEERAVKLTELAEELKKFYEDSGLADNLRAYLEHVDLDELVWSESFNRATASLIGIGLPGVGVILTKKGIFQLPPRGIPYDAVYLKPLELSGFVRRALGG